MMIQRRILPVVKDALKRQAAVALVGPRQVGKTTLAHAIVENISALYLDLEAREDREKLAEPTLFLRKYESNLVILDEVHRVSELFQTLHGLINEGRRHGRFLLLHRTTRDSYTSSLAVDSVALGLNISEQSRRPPDPRLACPSGSPLAGLCSEQTGSVSSKSPALYQCLMV